MHHSAHAAPKGGTAATEGAASIPSRHASFRSSTRVMLRGDGDGLQVTSENALFSCARKSVWGMILEGRWHIVRDKEVFI